MIARKFQLLDRIALDIREIGRSLPANRMAANPTTRRIVAQSKGVKLYPQNESPIAMVDGELVETLTGPQYKVIMTVLAAGDAGLTKDLLCNKSRHSSAHEIFKRLAKKSPWNNVLIPAGKPGGRYRIR